MRIVIAASICWLLAPSASAQEVGSQVQPAGAADAGFFEAALNKAVDPARYEQVGGTITGRTAQGVWAVSDLQSVDPDEDYFVQGVCKCGDIDLVAQNSKGVTVALEADSNTAPTLNFAAAETD